MENQNEFISTTIEFLDDKSDTEAFASISLNPLFNWAKFILTDSKANANNQRIPEEEFDNLIRTGTLAPIKMGKGKINEGHEESEPIGVISHLKKIGDKIYGLAAIWTREKPEEFNFIKKCYDEGTPINLSWEVLYSDSSTSDDGIIDLKNCILRATTLVGMPAYEGRTPIIALASKDVQSNSEGSPSEESSLEENKLEELEQLKEQVANLETKISEKDTEIEGLKSQLAELEELKEFKAGIEKERALASKLSSIKQKFLDSGLQKDEDYFESNKDMLLNLEEAALDFMIQELVAFSSKISTASHDVGVPNLTQTKVKFTPKELADELRKMESKK